MSAAIEIINKTRFNFGDNWQEFYDRIDEARINVAIDSLRELFPDMDFAGKSFVDVGCGSGLFSLAAQRLGANVVSFDYDVNSVECTEQLRKNFGDEQGWKIERGSVLDENFLDALGQFDIVYSWGVLHHTGEMYLAIEAVMQMVKPGGKICVALYNDQGEKSKTWLAIKSFYNRLPEFLRPALIGVCWLRLWGPTHLKDLLRGKPLKTWREYADNSVRGMSAWHDLVDWVGGLPFEVAKPENIIEFFKARRFDLEKLTTCAGGHGCNQYVFVAGTES